MTQNSKGEVETIEIKLLLEAIFSYYGFDFRDYAKSSLKRRIIKQIQQEQLSSISGLQEKLLHDSACMERFLLTMSINVSSFFRDPDFFFFLRKKVVPLLRTYPFVRIWLAGCSTGEEVYSMAIILQEEDTINRCRIYASDINEVILKKAQEGIFPLSKMQEYTKNYIKAGGKKSFSEYYTARYDNAIFRSEVKNNVVFCQHNLAMDGSFNEFNLILCRNVMIYFDKVLQERVHNLLYESLCMFGLLCLGKKEPIKFSPYEACYEAVDEYNKVYKKVK